MVTESLHHNLLVQLKKNVEVIVLNIFHLILKLKKIHDIFTILITEDRAIPYGVAAQKAMYQAQK